jgi:CheY-like chemotaxis protein
VPEAVLVVDDEPVVLQVLERVLPLRGLVVTAVRTAEEALERSRGQIFACLLTDKNLPGMSGLELIAKFRELQPDCACIIMTGYASTGSAVEALRLGANDYLEKPFQDIELVTEKVSHAIQNQRALADRALFLKQVLEFRKELQLKEGELAENQSQIRMFNEILEGRVMQATRDLRRERDELAARLARGGPATEGELVAVKMARMLLEQVALRPDVSSIRSELQRILRQLDAHMRSLREEPVRKR